MWRTSERGVTLLELLVVLAIMGLMVLAASTGVGRMRRSDLRADAGRMAAVMRSAFDRANATAALHRVVIDLDAETFRLERCEGKVKLIRSLAEAQEEEQKDVVADGTALAGIDSGSSIPGLGFGGPAPPMPGDAIALSPRCTPAPGALGRVVQLRKGKGIGVARVYAAHLLAPATEGKVTIHFFPLGTAERAVVEVADEDGDTYSLRLHPITGHVDMIAGAYPRADEFVSTDSEGKAVVP